MTDMDDPMQKPSPFEVYDGADVRALIESFPLAWVCAKGEASQLPLVGVFDAEDRLTELIGHFARTNPLGAAFAENPRATILFNGPQGYISPRHAGRRDWAPTWNYAQARIEAEISVEPELTRAALDILIAKMEHDAADAWNASELGARYERLLPMIVGFRARVKGVKAKFKLGQDEHPATLRTILSHIENEDLANWMRRFNSAPRPLRKDWRKMGAE